MGNGQIDGRFAPPQAHVEDVVAPRDGIELASRASRLFAVIIDSIILIAMFWMASVVTPWDVWHPKDPSLTAFKPLEAMGTLVLVLLPNLYLLATRGQSIGKYLLKIRIVRPDGSPAAFARLVGLRFVLSSVFQMVPAAGIVWSFADVLFIFRAPRRCLHDLIADTIVVKA
jgi:uncharacterized RDD family membrane protein YckC